MARKSYNTPKPDYWVTVGGRKRDGTKNPDSIEGYYLGSSTVADQEYEGKMKTTFMFRDSEGKVAGVNGNANLVFQFDDAKKNLAAEGLNILGMQTYIDFVGERKSEKKGRSPTKLFKVEFDPEDVIEVTGVAASAVVEESVDESSDEETYDDLGNADDEAAEPLAASAGQLSAAERKAKADEIVKKAKAARGK